MAQSAVGEAEVGGDFGEREDTIFTYLVQSYYMGRTAMIVEGRLNTELKNFKGEVVSDEAIQQMHARVQKVIEQLHKDGILANPHTFEPKINVTRDPDDPNKINVAPADESTAAWMIDAMSEMNSNG